MPFSKMKLGRRPPRHDLRTLQFSRYAGPALPQPPGSNAWSKKVQSWPVMLNDRLGDCAVAGPGHAVQCWTANAMPAATVLSDADILAAYCAVSGYNPNTGANDNGCVMLDVLNYWRQVGIGGHKILGYVQIDPRNHLHVMQAKCLFGGTYSGVSLPQTAKQQNVWDVPWFGPRWNGRPGSWGGHAIYNPDYDMRYVSAVTWGTLLPMTWRFWDTYMQECYAVLSTDWANADKMTPSGLTLDALLNDLAAVTN